MDMSIWESNCTFADPFTSFGGNESLQRFKNNADNLSKFVLNPKSKVTSYELILNKDNSIVKIG